MYLQMGGANAPPLDAANWKEHFDKIEKSGMDGVTVETQYQ